MNEAHELSDQRGYLPTELGEDRASTAVKLVAVACALALAATLLFGLMFLRKRQQDRLNSARQAEQAAHAVAPVEAQVFQDEVRLKGADATVSGSVKNVSAAQLEGLSVEIALKRRGSQEIETRTVQVTPNRLQTGEEGQYSLHISPTDWAGAQVVRLRSATRNADIAFKPEIGEKRPLDRSPSGNVIIEPRPHRKGDDFLNTPDTPIRIP
jgi:HAMP domain-containing protein